MISPQRVAPPDPNTKAARCFSNPPKNNGELPDWWNGVKAIFDSWGVPVAVWSAILWAESSGDTTACGDNGTSFGLFQLHWGGQGTGYTEGQLQDPYFNASVAAQYIGPAYQKYPTNISLVATHSGHPGPVPVGDHRVVNIANIFSSIQGLPNDAQRWFYLVTGKNDPSIPAPAGQDPTQQGGASAVTYPTDPSAAQGAAASLSLFNPFEWPSFLTGLLGKQLEQAAQATILNFGVLLIGIALVVFALFAFAFPVAEKVAKYA